MVGLQPLVVFVDAQNGSEWSFKQILLEYNTDDGMRVAEWPHQQSNEQVNQEGKYMSIIADEADGLLKHHETKDIV